jgi:O-antigen ligase/tetratricopeptide (TPR) repeat protein
VTLVDRRVCLVLQALVLVVPLLLGGRHPAAVALTAPVVLVTLAVTIRERRRRGERTVAPGVAMLATFVGLALATALPLPPLLLDALAPAAARLYRDALPGWPGAGDWTTWRSLALDPYGVFVELGRFSIGFGVFAVVVAYPWQSHDFAEAPGVRVCGRLLLTLIAGGAFLAALALLQEVAGNGRVLWISNAATQRGRASGPFVNPNHLAAWLEMVVPVALAYTLALAKRLRRRIRGAAHTDRSMGVRARRAWMAALIANQRRLGPPLCAGTAAVLMIVAHLATGSRGGMAALLVGLAVTGSGLAANTRRRDGRPALPRWTPAVLGLALLVASTAAVALWATAEGGDRGASAADLVDVSLGSRLAVSTEGGAIVRDHPLFGTGLGSWLHAFRPYQAPPVEGGIWDHAHNDYLELAAETGIAGLTIVLLFAAAVAGAARCKSLLSGSDHHASHSFERPPGFELSEWRAAFAESTMLRWGIAGGVAAILCHSVVEFGLRMPANLLTAMLLLALFVVSARRHPAAVSEAGEAPESGGVPLLADGRGCARRFRDSPALTALLVLLVIAALPRLANTARVLAGSVPLAPADCLDAADGLMADGDANAQQRARALVRRAIDRSPANRDAHVALAAVEGPGPEGEAALGRALALAPSSAELRDELALRLLARGSRAAGERELEESMFQFPYLVSHAYLSPDSDTAPRSAGQLIRTLVDGDTMAVRLETIDDGMAGAIQRGLERAADTDTGGPRHTGIVLDLVTLLEVRGQWADAAARLRAEADRGAASAAYFARAARDYLKARDPDSAEGALLAALLHTPEAGNLYRQLAVEVYASRGDFDMAATVLKAGERNALDMLPIYRGVTELLTRRQAADNDHAALAWAASMDNQPEVVEP